MCETQRETFFSLAEDCSWTNKSRRPCFMTSSLPCRRMARAFMQSGGATFGRHLRICGRNLYLEDLLLLNKWVYILESIIHRSTRSTRSKGEFYLAIYVRNEMSWMISECRRVLSPASMGPSRLFAVFVASCLAPDLRATYYYPLFATYLEGIIKRELSFKSFMLSGLCLSSRCSFPLSISYGRDSSRY